MSGYRRGGMLGFVVRVIGGSSRISVSYCMQPCIVSQGVHGLDRELKMS